MSPTHFIKVERGKLRETLDQLSGEGGRPKRKLIESNRTVYAGRRYDSAAEAAFAQMLDLEKAAGHVRSWTPQPRFDLEVNGMHVCRYTADFDVERPSGREIVEIKGYATPIWKLRVRLFRATWLNDHPGVEFRVIMTGRQSC